MLSRLVLVTALLAGLAMLIQAPAQASDRDYYRHDRYVEVQRAPAYYRDPRPAYYPPRYRPAPYYDARYRHPHRYRHHHHHHHQRDRDRYYYSDRRW